MFGVWDPEDLNDSTGTTISGDEVLIRTKHDLDAHEERYEYLTETVEDAVVSGETLEVTAELGVPSELGRYWGCFKVLRHGKKDFYCSFVYVPFFVLKEGRQLMTIRIVVKDEKALESMVMNTSLKEYRALEKMLAEQPLMQPTLKEMCNQHLITAVLPRF
jgi:hypothetical protein